MPHAPGAPSDLRSERHPEARPHRPDDADVFVQRMPPGKRSERGLRPGNEVSKLAPEPSVLGVHGEPLRQRHDGLTPLAAHRQNPPQVQIKVARPAAVLLHGSPTEGGSLLDAAFRKRRQETVVGEVGGISASVLDELLERAEGESVEASAVVTRDYFGGVPER